MFVFVLVVLFVLVAFSGYQQYRSGILDPHSRYYRRKLRRRS